MLVLRAGPVQARFSTATSEISSPLSKGKSVEMVASPRSQKFSRSARLSLKRLPFWATRVRLQTSVPPRFGLRVRRQTPSPSRNPLASTSVISWSYQSESAANLVVVEGSLSKMVSGPLPTIRTLDRR